MTKVKNMTSTNGNTAANQFIITTDNTKVFQSYDSTIAIYNYDNGTLELYSDWDYSRTTLKYLKQFINNELYSEFEYESKSKFEKEIEINDKIIIKY